MRRDVRRMTTKQKPKTQKLPTLKQLNCDNFVELGQRAQFQDWITDHIGCLPPKERDTLWDGFKLGMTFIAKGEK